MSGAGTQALPSAEPVDIPVEPASAGHGPVAEPDPRAQDEDEPGVRADPTWPENGAAEDSDESTESEDGVEGDEDTGNGFSLSHVPVKRKGSRKR